MKTRVSLKYFVAGCLWKFFFGFNSPQTSLNLISQAFSVTLMLCTVFLPRFSAFKLQKRTQFSLTL